MTTRALQYESRCRPCVAGLLLWCSLLSSCTEKAEPTSLTPPLPADLAQLDPAIAAAIREQAEQVRAFPAQAASWRRLGMLYHGHQELRLAAECYEQSLQRERDDATDDATDDARTWYYLALARKDLGRSVEARRAIAEATWLAPRYVPCRWRSALWLLDEGYLDEARKMADEAGDLDPDDPAPAIVLARVHMQAGRYQESATVLERLLERRPDDRYARFLLGTAYRHLRRPADAQRELGDGTPATPPVWRDAWADELGEGLTGFRADFERALAMAQRGELEEGKRLFMELRKRRPDDVQVLSNLAAIHQRLGNHEESLSLYERILAREPENSSAHLLAARAYHRKIVTHGGKGRSREWLSAATRHATEALRLAPGNAAAYATKGDLARIAGQSDVAIELYYQAADVAGRDSAEGASYLLRIAWHLSTQRRLDEAAMVLEEVEPHLPEDADNLYRLGVLKAGMGRVDRAETLLRRAGELRPNDERIRRALERLRRGSLSPESEARGP